ncbi:hypothetical protein LXL04_034543 [Taraxacum kok-saghyz]
MERVYVTLANVTRPGESGRARLRLRRFYLGCMLDSDVPYTQGELFKEGMEWNGMTDSITVKKGKAIADAYNSPDEDFALQNLALQILNRFLAKFLVRMVFRNETIRRIELSPAHRAGTPLHSCRDGACGGAYGGPRHYFFSAETFGPRWVSLRHIVIYVYDYGHLTLPCIRCIECAWVRRCMA